MAFTEGLILPKPVRTWLFARRGRSFWDIWQGLGLLQQGQRNLHFLCQKMIWFDAGGKFPRYLQRGRSLIKRGLGTYMRAAISSFLHSVEVKMPCGKNGNVFSRGWPVFSVIDTDIAKRKGEKRIWNLANQLIPEEEPAHSIRQWWTLEQDYAFPKNP